MIRYSKYFLEHILWLEDDFCQYYLQDESWGRKEILDAQSLIFFWPEEAEQWLAQCADFNHFTTLRRLRGFLCDGCLEKYQLHRMNDRQVLCAAARQICLNALQLVIHPKTGWAVQLDPQAAEPLQPITVEAEPELAPLLVELKGHLDALVAEQRQKYDRYETRLAKMSPEQKALLYSKKAGGAVYDSAVGGVLDLVKAAPGMLFRAAKAFPGFYSGYLKLLWKVAQTPGQMAALTAQGLTTGDFNPLRHEIDQIVAPVAQGFEQAQKYRSMLTVLLNDEQTYKLLYDFAGRYYSATHPLELTEMGVSAVADIVVTILLAVVTAGVGAAANVAAKSGRLAKVAKLLEKITVTIRRVGHRQKLIGKAEEAARAGKTERRAAKAAHEIKVAESEVKRAKQTGKLEIEAAKGYDATKEIDRSKKILRTGVGATGEGIPIERVKPDVLKEVHPDSKAAYGYSPNKGTAYEKIDFTDVEAAKKNRGIRTEYLDGSERLDNEIKIMRTNGASSEEIGRHVVNERNLQKVDARKYMKPDEIKILEERNIKKYSNPIGPTADDIFEGTKENLIDKGLYESDTQVWEHVIEKSMKKDDVINTLLGIEH